MVSNMKDGAKYTLVVAEVLLSYLCLWPLNKNVIIRFIRYFIFLNIIVLGTGEIHYMINNVTDVIIMAYTCTTFSTKVQTLSKILLLTYYSEDLCSIITTISNDFWPADLIDKSTERSIRRSSKLIVIFFCIYISVAFFSCWDYMAINLVFGKRILPYKLTYINKWDRSPLFEILYVWDFIFGLYGTIQTMGTHDFFFNALVTNCIAQFKLLSTVLLTIGTGKDKIVNKKIKSFKHYANRGLEDDEEFELVAKCVKHHNLVLDICDKLQLIFGAIISLQFFISALALCVSSFISIHVNGSFTPMVLFSTVHLIQFFFLCTVGNQLLLGSASIADAAYMSEWNNISSIRVKKALMLIIQRAQKEQGITAMGIANLDYPNFVEILRISFSFYTLLSSIEE